MCPWNVSNFTKLQSITSLQRYFSKLFEITGLRLSYHAKNKTVELLKKLKLYSSCSCSFSVWSYYVCGVRHSQLGEDPAGFWDPLHSSEPSSKIWRNKSERISGKSRTFEKNIRHRTVSVVAYDLRTRSKYSCNSFRGKFVHLLKLHSNPEMLFSTTIYRRADRSIESNISVINIYKFILKPSYVANIYKNTGK